MSLPGPGLGLLGAGAAGETLPPVATSIEQLLERQWNEGQSFLLQQGAQGDGELKRHTHSQRVLKVPINAKVSLFVLRVDKFTATWELKKKAVF